MTSNEELKPCPFCGGKDITINCTHTIDGYKRAQPYNVECDYCGACSFPTSTDKSAIKEWNTRPIEEALQARIDELEKQLPVWRDIESAPKYEVTFLLRKKTEPHVIHEGMVFRDRESWEIPQEYDVVQDMTLDVPIDDWSCYEWSPLPTPPEQGENDE